MLDGRDSVRGAEGEIKHLKCENREMNHQSRLANRSKETKH